jgi:transcriptional regulator with XRE-family HTH domain
MSTSPVQAKAARVALGWSQAKLAGASGVSTSSIKGFEYGRKLPSAGIREAIELALEAAGAVLNEKVAKGRGAYRRL